MKAKHYFPACVAVAAITLFFTLVTNIAAQKKMDRIERETMKLMLKNIKSSVKKEYYDEKFRGIDLEARFDKTEARLDEVDTTGEALAAIAQTLIDFNDSHLYFVPPSTNIAVEYGWRHQMYGDKLFVTIVKPKSDAYAQGLRPGDQIVSIEGFKPVRKEMWKVMYFYNVLNKRTALRISVLSPGADSPKALTIESKIRKLPKVYTAKTVNQIFDTSGKSVLDFNYFRSVGDTMIWKMPTFGVAPSTIDTLYGKVRGSKNLILDLRGNGGGAVVSLERLAGLMFDKDLKIADLKGRKPMDPMESKSRGSEVYRGQLVVLIDGDSGSAAEIFARLVQIEGRGKVLGDVSAGAVMQSTSPTLFLGSGDEIAYSVSVTNADVIMSDGKSLEHVGVVPDVVVLPSAADLAAGNDPVIAEAVKLLGSTISSKDAGQMFRLKWTEDSRGEEIIEVDTK